MRPIRELNDREKAAMALMATGVAGFVDCFGYLTLSRIYSANMTGNSISFALRSVQFDWGEAARRGWPVLIFVVGLIASAIVHEAGTRRSFYSTSSITLGVEALLLGAFAALAQHWVVGTEIQRQSGWMFYLFVSLLTLAMGLQNATIARIGALSLRTTHVTGTLSQFGEAASKYIFWFYDRTRGRDRRRFLRALRLSARHKHVQAFSLMAGLWIIFVIGAALAAYTRQLWNWWALLLPIPVLLILVVVDLVRPIAAAAEHVGQPQSSAGRLEPPRRAA